MFDYDDLDELGPAVRIWAVSDVHVDMQENMQWIQSLSASEAEQDILILAGDISNKLDLLRETLCECKRRYARVFFCPGNHDLWHTSSKAKEDAITKLRRILDVCEELGVDYKPATITAGSEEVLIVPFQSWHHPQWDVEPEIQGWDGVVEVHKVMVDYYRTSWPPEVQIKDGTAAKAVDAVNDELFDMKELLQQRHGLATVVSFSHMLPRVELNPEKRYLEQPSLAKACGSTFLRDRVDRLRPDVHVFGHTHFGYDIDLDGIRYIQAPLSYPAEREHRGTTVAVGDEFPSQPFLIWSTDAGWVPKGRGGAWSEYMRRYGRRPDVTSKLPSYVANNLRPAGEEARVGWIAGRMPVWLFGPLPMRQREAERTVQQIRGVIERGNEASWGQPRRCEARELVGLHSQRRCNIVDIRRSVRRRILRSVALPHPTATQTLPCLPDEELLELCERLMANEGPMVLLGPSSTREGQHAAMVLAAFLRLWVKDILLITGGLEAWTECGGEVEEL